MSKKRVTMDFETRSACDLKSAGAYKYSLDPTTRATCLAFKIHGKPTIYFLDFDLINKPWHELPTKFKNIWSELIFSGFEFSAHNAFFEKCIYYNVLAGRLKWPYISPRRWRCTAAKAAACALPRNLEGAGAALNLTIQKDKRGHAAVMATCKPTKQWNAWIKKALKNGDYRDEPAKFRTPETDPEIFQTLYTYCKFDVLSEEELDDRLPDLNPIEQEVWFLNQEINWRGIRVDIPTIRKIVGIMNDESKKKLKELDSLTMGLVRKPGARKAILDFLELEGVTIPNMQAQTVNDALSGFKISSDAAALLKLRQELSKTSTKKFEAFLKRASDDGRVRDILLYHGASTGRDAGTGIQIQNFPRGLIKVDKARPYAAVENVKELDAEMLKILYGENLAILFSALLRNMILPSQGRELFVADFSKIEVAVLWWMSGNEPGLKILRDGLDPYKYMAAANTGKAYAEIGDEGDERQLGKAQVLGCGFGMGWSKFQQTAWDVYRLKLTDEQSKNAVRAYREANKAVPDVWNAIEQSAIFAVENSNNKTFAARCAFFVEDGFLWITLPSGRRLAYCEPRISWRYREFEYEEKLADGTIVKKTESRGPFKTLEFMAVNSKTKKWSLERTWGGTLTENVVQACARDLLMHGLLAVEREGYQTLFAVHDEAVCERKAGERTIDDFVKTLCRPPTWAAGLPFEAKGWAGKRYRK